MSVMMFHATSQEEHVGDIDKAVNTMLAAIHAHHPQGCTTRRPGWATAPLT